VAREHRAIHRNAPVAPLKARRVADLIRGRSVNEAREILRHTNRRAAYLFERVLHSAVANADEAGSADVDDLVVARAWVDEGTRLKRWKPGPMGRVRPILRRRSHLGVALSGPE
jgi:large subunit ribosomal protein L22